MERAVTFGIQPSLDSADDVRYELESYFNVVCDNESEWTLSGLACHLGMSLSELQEFAKRGDDRGVLVRRAMTLLASVVERDMRARGKGHELTLKQTGYQDEVRMDVTHGYKEMPRVMVSDGFESKELVYKVGKRADE